MSTTTALICAAAICVLGAGIINMWATIPAVAGCVFVFLAVYK